MRLQWAEKCLYLYYTNQQTRYNTSLRTPCRATKGVVCMDKQSRTYQAYVQILKEELIPAMGCTEPIAIAYAAARRCRGLQGQACRRRKAVWLSDMMQGADFSGYAYRRVPIFKVRSRSFSMTASTASVRPRAIWCRSMLGVPSGLPTACSIA